MLIHIRGNVPRKSIFIFRQTAAILSFYNILSFTDFDAMHSYRCKYRYHSMFLKNQSRIRELPEVQAEPRAAVFE